MKTPLIPLLLPLLVAFAAFAQDAAEMERRLAALPADAPSVIDLKGIDGFHLSGSAGSAKVVPVEGQPFATARQIRTATKPASPFAFQLGTKTKAPIKTGDVLLAVFWARGVERPADTDEARTEFCVELGREPYTKSAVFTTPLGRPWAKYYVPFTAKSDLASGEAQVLFRCGYDPQVIEIADFSLRNFGKIDRKTLPYTPVTYTGREADAPWRAAAAERIERIRKSDLAVTVRDAAGRPVPGATVRVRMKRHAFGWGTAVDAAFLLGKAPEAEHYRATLLADFNTAVVENHLKWTIWEHDRVTGPSAIAWLRERGIPTRGHCLVWPGKANLPKSVIPLLDGDPAKLRDTIDAHITDQLGTLAGQCRDWDVLNEPFTNKDVQRVLGESILGRWFHTAHAADPAARLFINDYSILETGGTDHAHQDYYFNTIKSLRDTGVPIHGIGIQGHFSEDLTPIPRLGQILDRFATLGLPIQITELDVNTSDENLAGEYTRDFLTMVFSHPVIDSVLVWGFWEKRHWIPGSAFYRADWTLRPAGTAWKNLTQKQWWTDETLKTDAAGRIQLRGFHGDYEITAQLGERSATAPLRLPAAGASATVALP